MYLKTGKNEKKRIDLNNREVIISVKKGVITVKSTFFDEVDKPRVEVIKNNLTKMFNNLGIEYKKSK